jgi:hypothetical protein
LRIAEQLGDRSAAMLGDWRAERLSDGGVRMVHPRSGTQVTHWPDGSERLLDRSGRVRLTGATGAVEWRKPDRVNTRPTLGGGSRNSSLTRMAAQRGRISRPPAGVRSGAAPAPTTSLSMNRLTVGSGTGPMLACGGVHAVLGEDSPAMPTDMAIEARPTGGFVVRWSDRSSNESGFEIERQPAFSGGPRAAPANATSFVDLDNPGLASYRVRAVGVRLQSDWSEWQSFTGAPPPNFATLTPGGGFTGPTFQPAPVGEPGAAGYDARVIARWDVVPFQTFGEDFLVGVVAFHMNGVERVDFSVNDGPWTAVREMQLNPATGVWEYTARLRASDFADGPVELRAIAWPSGAGEPRVLGGVYDSSTALNGEHALTLYANRDGTLTHKNVFVAASGDDQNPGTESAPVRTFDRALRIVRTGGAPHHATILVTEPGDYELPNYTSGNDQFGPVTTTTAGWVTIRPGDGLAPRSVVISNATRRVVRPRVVRLAFDQVAVDFGTVTQFYMDSPIWFHRSHWFDTAGTAVVYPGLSLPVRGQGYATDSTATHLIYGFAAMMLARGVSTDRVDGDVFSNTKLLVNSEARNVGGTGGSQWHSDILQHFGHNANVIAYGVRSEALRDVQSIFLDHYQSTHTDFAFVDVDFDNTYALPDGRANGGAPFTQLNAPHRHVLFRNVRLPHQRVLFRTDFTGDKRFTAQNVIFDGCTLHSSFPLGSLPPGVSVRNIPSGN